MTKTSTAPVLLTAARLTMLSWAKLMYAYEDLPEVFRPAFDLLIHEDADFPHIVLTPARDGYFHKLLEKLIFEVDGVIYVLEEDGGQVHTTGYPITTVRDLEIGTILLISWITVSGVDLEGNLSVATLAFNTTTLRLFTPFIESIRPEAGQMDEAAWQAEKSKFDYLGLLSFKFMNYARASLTGGETVLQSIWQPEIKDPRFTLFRKTFYRTVSPPHLTILTDRELILIIEDIRVTKNKEDRYGGIWHYIPLRSIEAVSIREEAERLVLAIDLIHAERIERVFPASGKIKLEHLSGQIEKLLHP